MMHRLAWAARRWRQSVGWPLAIGCSALVACLLVYILEIVPLAARLDTQQESLAALQSRGEARSDLRSTRPATEQLTAFYAFFPASEVVPEVLGRLFEGAARENLAVPQGEYRQSHEVAGRLTRYELILPLKGSYPGLRRFIAQALRDTPSLSLQGVTFNRQGAGEIGVEAQVRFALYVRSEGT